MRASYPHNVPAAWKSIVERYPTGRALVWSQGSTVTFAELDRLSDRVAFFLGRQGVGKGDRVCIRLDKCTLAYSVIVACLKIGAPYFVIDPSNPAVRADHIVAKCMPKVAFSAKEWPIELSLGRLLIVDKQDPLSFLNGISEDMFHFHSPIEILGTDPAYIMFTSGSTGFPKGAVMSHANLLNFIGWVKSEFEVTPDDIFTNVNPLYFDNSVFDVYGSLFNGASLVPFDTATMKDPYKIIERIDQLRCTIYFSVPSLLIYFQTLKLITPNVFEKVRTIVFGGEGYPKPKLKELFDCFRQRVRLVNVYGPTECTCICSAYEISAADFVSLDGYPPLGALIPNFSYTILNDLDEPVAPNEAGELCLGGPSVGLGYFNEIELSQEAFRQNPLNSYFHERTYRTGDIVRLSAEDGKLYFVGRRDSQVKHQGYRVELGEVEHALCRVAGIDEAVALHSVRDGISRIIAVAASRSGMTAETLKTEVGRLLPAYMVPCRIDILDRLPKNANGKIDRNLLKTTYC